MGGPIVGRRRVRRAALLSGVLLAGVLAACGPDGGEGSGERPTARSAFGPLGSGSAEASPFVAGPAPEGYELAAAGPGEVDQSWGEDCCGTDEPFTLLSRDGTAAGDDLAIVSLTSLWPYEHGGGGEDGADRRVVHHAPADPDGGAAAPWRGWAEIVVAVDEDDDLALRVRSPDASRHQLEEIAAASRPTDDRSVAPVVDDPPDGWTVVGSADAALAIAFTMLPRVGQTFHPGPLGSHLIGWADDDAGLAVIALPGRSVDLAVLDGILAGWPAYPTEVEVVDVGGRPGLAIDVLDREDASVVERRLVTTTEWGDVLVVTADFSRNLTAELSAAELVALAETVEQTDAAGVEAFVIEATGGPGLRPDEGRTELARGQAGDLEWILQTGVDESGRPSGLDPCLKLSTRRRACVFPGTQGSGDSVQYAGAAWADERHGMPPFFLMWGTTQAVAMRVVAGDEAVEAVEAPLYELPDGWWGGIAFIDAPGLITCMEEIPEGIDPDVATARVELLGADGEVVACRGFP